MTAYLKLLRQAGAAWMEDGAASMGAALAFYSAFSLAPLLLIASGVAGLVFGSGHARAALVQQFTLLIGPVGGEAVDHMLQSTSQIGHGLIATAIGVGLLLVGASTVLLELQNDLDRIWHAPPRSHSGYSAMIRTRLAAFGLVLGFGFLLLVSLGIGTALDGLMGYSSWLSRYGSVLHWLHSLLSLGVFTLLFAMLYKWLPNVHLAWRDVWWGASVTACLFTIGQFGIGFYLGRSTTTSAYAAAASLLVLLLWLYYAAQIFLFGAECTWAYVQHRRRSARVRNPRKRPASTGLQHPLPH